MKKNVAIIAALLAIACSGIGIGYAFVSANKEVTEEPTAEVVETTQFVEESTQETEEWVMPTGETDFTIEVETVAEREPEADEKVYTIHADTWDFEVGEKSLQDWDTFNSDEYLQRNLSEFLFDIENNWIQDSFEYTDGVLRVQVEGVDATLTIDVEAGTIEWER